MRQECLAEGWYFPHNDAPTAMDLHHILSRPGADAIRMTAEMAYSMLHEGAKGTGQVDAVTWQLMLVLPPQSSTLLQGNYVAHAIVSGNHGPTSYMYPKAFQLSTYARERLHECAPILPDLDCELLAEAVASVIVRQPRL